MQARGGKQYILDYVEENTKNINWNNIDSLTAGNIAEAMGLSRNVVSQYLNEFHDQEVLVKVNTRPVYFFHKSALEIGLSQRLPDVIYNSIEELKNEMRHRRKRSAAFDELIGKSGSLSYCVEQCKSAVAYPGNGLAILLHGPTGTGKSLIAQLMYNYGVEKGHIRPEGKFVVMNCSEFANNPELLLTNLFGYKKGAYTGADATRTGLVAAADGGVLFLDEVHCLKAECQEKLFLLMDKGIYHMVGDNEKWYNANVRMIFATTEEPETALLKTTLRRIPIVSKIPPLNVRPLNEKKELIQFVLTREEKQLNRSVLVSEMAYQTILNFNFTGNVGQMINYIKASVASSLSQSEDKEDEEVKIGILNLPEMVLQSESLIHCTNRYNDKTMLNIDELFPRINPDNLLVGFNREMLDILRKSVSQENIAMYFVESSEALLKKYQNSLLYDKKNTMNPKEAFTEKSLSNICAIVSEKYGFTFYNNEISLLCKFVSDYILNMSFLITLRKPYQNQLIDCINIIRESFHYDYLVTSDLIKLIEDSLGVYFDWFGYIDMFLFVRSFEKWMDNSQPFAVVAAHGYSTASSLSSTANQLLGKNVYAALDLPASSHTNDMAAQLISLLNKYSMRKEVLVLFDIGSIENLGNAVAALPDTDIGLFENVTLRLMLEAGKLLADKTPVDKIVAFIDNQLQGSKGIYIRNRKKPLAILTVCTTGISFAEKITDLIQKSFPKTMDIQYISRNYDSLVLSGNEDLVFEKYEVLFIVGEIDPKVPDIPFVSIEEMVERVYTKEIADKLSTILSKEEQDIFNHNIVKNFSLQNLLDYLIILNPEKIMSHVEVVIQRIQAKLGITINNSTMVGLYLHISCLIERLITDRYITSYANLDQFVEEQGYFIERIQLIFQDIEKNYGVQIPVSEIGYLYDHLNR